MTVFAPLLRELDAWAEQGRSTELWWRDDDATEATAALATMLDLAAESRVPLALAVIPMTATPALAAALAGLTQIAVWQHGIRHADNAVRPAKKQELTGTDPSTRTALQDGYARLDAMFGDRARPVLVPPWNRIAPGLVPALPGLGYRGLSAFQPRQAAMSAPGLIQVNTHVDLLDWRSGAAFLGAARCTEAICAHMQAKRRGTADPAEPTGVLSHHLVMKSDAWDFLCGLFMATNAHPGCNWIMPDFSVT